MTRADGRHARHQLDGLIHAPVRFSIMAALAAADEVEFARVRDVIEISDSVLSRQSTQLESAGYVRIRKGYVGKRPRTWLSLTSKGRAAYSGHLNALREIAAGLAGAGPARPPQATRRPSAGRQAPVGPVDDVPTAG